MELSPELLRGLAIRIGNDIDAFCVESTKEDPRSHLGASQIGDKCARKLWYNFRWVEPNPVLVNSKTGADVTGRMKRLWNRGHREEERLIKYLRGIGFEVKDFQADGKTQYRISDVSGHFGGSLDAQLKVPTRYGILPEMLGEFKTANEKRFKKLQDEGVKLAEPKYYCQMCTYGQRYGYHYAIYFSVCKNDDQIYIEIVKLDWDLADKMTQKAHQIIRSPVPPARISEFAGFFECKWCEYKDNCHNSKPSQLNCRSCKFAQPSDNGEWICLQHGNQVIPKDFQLKGCSSWQDINV